MIFAVAAHRAIQALQVTVDHKIQVAQFLRPPGNGPKRLRLITLAVAHETPDLAIAMVKQTALLLILHDVGLVNRLNGAQAP